MIKEYEDIIRDTQLIDLVTTSGSASVPVVSAKLRVFTRGIAYAIYYTPSNGVPCFARWGTQIIEDSPDTYFPMILLNCSDSESFEDIRLD
jgi:hypothetical protein